MTSKGRNDSVLIPREVVFILKGVQWIEVVDAVVRGWVFCQSQIEIKLLSYYHVVFIVHVIESA